MKVFLLFIIQTAIAGEYNNNDFRKEYSYLLTGEFTHNVTEFLPIIPNDTVTSEIGILNPDGDGILNNGAFKNTIVGGSVQFSGFLNGTYDVTPDGIVNMIWYYFNEDGSTLGFGNVTGILTDRNRQLQFYTLPGLSSTEHVTGLAIKR